MIAELRVLRKQYKLQTDLTDLDMVDLGDRSYAREESLYQQRYSHHGKSLRLVET